MEACQFGSKNWKTLLTRKYILWVVALQIWNFLISEAHFLETAYFNCAAYEICDLTAGASWLWWCTNYLQRKRLQNCSGKYTESVRSWTECNAVLHHQHKPGFKTAQSCKLCGRFASRGQNSRHRRKIARTEVGHVGRPECLFPQMLRGASVKAASVKKRHVC